MKTEEAMRVASTLAGVAATLYLVWTISPALRLYVTGQAKQARCKVTAARAHRQATQELRFEVFLIEHLLDRYNLSRDSRQLADLLA